MSASKAQGTKMATKPTAAPPTPREPPDGGMQALKAGVLARRERILKGLRDGYPAAGAAEALLLRVASADAACLEELQECEAALAGLFANKLVREPGPALAGVRLAREFSLMAATLRSRLQQSLTAAVTIMATARIAGAYDRDGGK